MNGLAHLRRFCRVGFVFVSAASAAVISAAIAVVISSFGARLGVVVLLRLLVGAAVCGSGFLLSAFLCAGFAVVRAIFAAASTAAIFVIAVMVIGVTGFAVFLAFAGSLRYSGLTLLLLLIGGRAEAAAAGVDVASASAVGRSCFVSTFAAGLIAVFVCGCVRRFVGYVSVAASSAAIMIMIVSFLLLLKIQTII